MIRDPIAAAFDQLRELRPERVLVASPRRRTTAAELDRLAGTLEPALAGLAPGTLVGLDAPDGTAFLAGYLALRRRSLVPLLVDHRSPPEEKQRLAAGLGCAWCLATTAAWPERPGDFVVGPTGPSAVPPRRLDPATGAVKLTSGSTGAPRGIVTPAAALAADDRALAATMGLAADERILAVVPMSHSYGLSSIVLPALVRGSTVVLAEPGSGPSGPLRAAHALEATFFPAVPPYLHALLRQARPPALPESLRLTISAGAALPVDVARRFRAVYGRPVHVFYGASECGGITYDRTGEAGERGEVGTPVDGVAIELAPTGDERPGAVVVRSAAVAAAYLEPAGLGDGGGRLGGGRFRSSDLARWRDGRLVLAGRTDDLINVKGKMVDPREVERVLAGLAGVDEVAVVGIRSGDRPGAVVAAVVAGGGDRPDRVAVIDWCRGRLSEHKVPRVVALVEALPRTPRGKLDRRAVAELAAGRAPDPGGRIGNAPAAGGRSALGPGG